MKWRFLLASLAVSVPLTFGSGAQAASKPFDDWLADIRVQARQQGISQQTIDNALTGISPIQRVIELDRKQPEGTMDFKTYRNRIVTQQRIQKGQEMMRRHAKELATAEQKYGVPAQYIVALWAIESNFGGNTGGFEVIDALATLAWDGRRSDFFTRELMHALRIIDQGHVSHTDMKGSWAGAMGQNQFMPSSFHNYAVDGDGDGKKDIWTNVSDVFASTANYLSSVGWKGSERWGRQVLLTPELQRLANSEQNTGLHTRATKSLDEWRRLGMKTVDGQPIPVAPGMRGTIVQPDGDGTPAFLVYDNYRAIMHWNKSVYFATSVGLLANGIAASPN